MAEKHRADLELPDAPADGPSNGQPSSKKQRRVCPYLDTVDRHMLDFDFEKVCSVSLTNINVYACLVCGKYFQGRGKGSHAYFHSLQANHHVFMNLHTDNVYCLPDGYEVDDASLSDVKQALNPSFKLPQVARFDTEVIYSRTLENKDFIPGTVGLNNIKETDYINVVIQSLVRVSPLRDFFLFPENYSSCKSLLVQRFGELVRKVWNPLNFKDQVSPHEFVQAVSIVSNKRFLIGKQGDPSDFLIWLLNTLHKDLGGTKKRDSSIIYKTFQGEVEVLTEKLDKEKIKKAKREKEEAAKAAGGEVKEEEEGPPDYETLPKIASTETVPFLFLGLDLPPPPLFKDAQERNIIPQIPLFTLLDKYNGVTWKEFNATQERKRYRIKRLPRYLIFDIKRFTKNTFFDEKNPTIVNFPVKNLELKDYLPDPAGAALVPSADPGPSGEAGAAAVASTKYDLVANVAHEGKPNAGIYKVYAIHKASEQWYDLQDLNVSEIIPQIVALSEALIQVYECKPPTAARKAAAAAAAAAAGAVVKAESGAQPAGKGAVVSAAAKPAAAAAAGGAAKAAGKPAKKA
eukprot:tig00021314_g20123.t1